MLRSSPPPHSLTYASGVKEYRRYRVSKSCWRLFLAQLNSICYLCMYHEITANTFILLNTMKALVYKTPECRIVEVRIDTAFLGSPVITGYPGSDDPIIDEGELD